MLNNSPISLMQPLNAQLAKIAVPTPQQMALAYPNLLHARLAHPNTQINAPKYTHSILLLFHQLTYPPMHTHSICNNRKCCTFTSYGCFSYLRCVIAIWHFGSHTSVQAFMLKKHHWIWVLERC